MTLEQLLIIKWFIVPVAVIVMAIPAVFIYSYMSEWRKRRNNRARKR